MITVVLMEPETSGNIGAVARVMKNFGLRNLVLVNPQCEIDETARQRATHGIDVLENAEIRKDVGDFDIVVATTAQLSRDYDVTRTPILPSELRKTINPQMDIALLFGREGDGLTREEIGNSDFLLTIPSSKEYPTLNLSHSVAIILYELQQRDLTEDIPPMKREEKEQIIFLLDELIDTKEWQTPEKKENQKRIWKNILGRSFLSNREATSIIGFLKKLR